MHLTAADLFVSRKTGRSNRDGKLSRNTGRPED